LLIIFVRDWLYADCLKCPKSRKASSNQAGFKCC